MDFAILLPPMAWPALRSRQPSSEHVWGTASKTHSGPPVAGVFELLISRLPAPPAAPPQEYRRLAIAALAAFDGRPVGIIIGGHDRGLNYQPLADAIATRRSPTWIVGVPQSGLRIGELIARTCANSGSTNATVVQVDDFDDAVPALLALVPAGGVLLLSPAAPSFGRFTDYRERGMRFRSLLGL